MTFPVSGVETAIWVPPLVACVVSFFTSIGGLSGAFLLLPFQVSVLGFTNLAVTPTNLVFNVVGIPSGVYRYIREGRMAWPLAWNIIAGTLPGLFVGGVIRIRYLPDPRSFKLFAGAVLFYMGVRMVFQSISSRKKNDSSGSTMERMLRERHKRGASLDRKDTDRQVIRTVSWSLYCTEYEFYGTRFRFNTMGLFAMSLLVGIVGGIYGIGGGAIIAPFIVSFFGLPVHTIAGATLMGTCVTSVGGVIFYTLMDIYLQNPGGSSVAPDWTLGLLFGVGGFVGMYLGAGAQKYVPSAIIKPALALVLTSIGLRYILAYWF